MRQKQEENITRREELNKSRKSINTKVIEITSESRSLIKIFIRSNRGYERIQKKREIK